MLYAIRPGYRTSCPFCQDRFHPAMAQFRPSDGPRLPDEAISRFFGGEAVAPNLPAASVPAWRWWNHFLLVRQNNGNGHWICPRCHLPIPPAAARGELNPRSLAIFGARGAGKSNWFAVLIKLLKERYGGEVGFALQDMGTWGYKQQCPINSWRLYQERYGRRLFEQRLAIDQTASAGGNPAIRVPLMYRLRFDDGKILDLSVFDAAGEELDDPQKLERFYDYLSTACGIICILDPERLPGFRGALPLEEQQRIRVELGHDPIIGALLQYFDGKVNARTRRKIKHVPMAVAYSKSDHLVGRVDPNMTLLRDSSHQNGFNDQDSRRVNQEMRALVQEWGGEMDLKLLDARFDRTRVFSFSALGKSPGQDLFVGTINPKRVGDPLLWVLAELGYIPRVNGG
jgi:hypothetical protein